MNKSTAHMQFISFLFNFIDNAGKRFEKLYLIMSFVSADVLDQRCNFGRQAVMLLSCWSGLMGVIFTVFISFLVDVNCLFTVMFRC